MAICAHLEKAGTPIGSLDMLIAAHALSCNPILLTHNLKGLKRVQGLKAEDWTKG
jgi:tRNA(fMet)-specific endonuclease VapC